MKFNYHDLNKFDIYENDSLTNQYDSILEVLLRGCESGADTLCGDGLS
jgi:hypothetical protein